MQNFMMYHLHMKLSQYLKENKITQDEFLSMSKEFGGSFSIHAVSKWCQGQRIPRQDEMRIIYKITDGEVTPNDFYSLQKNIS